jgi:hypothetical protein
MQNRYVGDVGDFLKYGFLNFLFQNQSASPKFKLGVNWYLVPNEKNKADGKYTDYLKPENRFSKKLQECNPKLYRQMKEIVFVKKKRNIAEIEKGNVLPRGTIFYSEPIGYDNMSRTAWHQAALEKLEKVDVVFLDPDNGIETVKMYSAGEISPKHALFQETVDYYERGQSVIIYNHKSRQKEEIYQERFKELKRKLESSPGKAAYIYILRANRYTVRDFVFLVQRKHEKRIKKLISSFMTMEWKEHFTRLPPPS